LRAIDQEHRDKKKNMKLAYEKPNSALIPTTRFNLLP
jgi:hypothetical protein